jgi:hypothetical protein
MDLTLREGYWITFCMKVIAVISHDNYYCQFIALFVNWYNNIFLPVIRQFFLFKIELMSLWISDSKILPHA